MARDAYAKAVDVTPEMAFQLIKVRPRLRNTLKLKRADFRWWYRLCEAKA